MASPPSLTLMIALIAFSGAKSAFKSAQSDSNCLASNERGTAVRATPNLFIVNRGWISHDIVSTVMEIVLKELLGYKVFNVDASGGSDANWASEMANGSYDIEMESWHASATIPDYQFYVVKEKIILNPGPIGYSGRSGLWTFNTSLKVNRFADYYEFYLDQAAFATGILTFAESNLIGFLGEDFPVCNKAKYAWCGRGLLEGYWAPPQCESNPGECLEIFMAVPGFDTGYFEQLTRNLGLRAIHGYYGWDMPDKIQALKAEGKTPIFYWWEPHPLLQSVNALRINFPQYFQGCDVGNNQDPNTGTTKCDYGEKILQKLITTRLLHDAPEAYYVLSKFEVNAADLTSMLQTYADATGANASKKIACDYVRTLLPKLNDSNSSVPSCLSHPIGNPNIGDFVFRRDKMECVNTTVVYPTAISTSTCSGIQKGTNINTAVTIKIVKRKWVSHSLLSAIVELILKERLGYEVEMIDASSESDARRASSGSDPKWGPEMAEGMYDVDIEAWNAGRSSNSYKEYVLNKEVVSPPSSIGYSGRSGLWILESASQAHRFAKNYKFFLNASHASRAGFLTFGESALPSFVGGGFPICTGYNWCGSDNFTGYWVPPQCEEDPDACIEVFMAVPEYDTGYFEQLTRNLDVKFIHGYYGSGLPDKVLAIQTDPKTPVFYWYEPDPFLQIISAQRVSFPKHYYGCDLGNNADPDTGSISCDYGEKPLQKLIKADLRERAPEAFYFLTNFHIYKAEIETMMASTRDGGGNYSVGEAACEFITGNEDKFFGAKGFAPDCIAKPLTSIPLGSRVFNRSSLTCQKVDCPENKIIKRAALNGFFCDLCPNGTVPNLAQVHCDVCQEGKAVSPDLVRCQACKIGTFSNRGGLTACLKCPQGRFAEEPGQLECTPCKKNEYSSTEGATTCEKCAAYISESITELIGATTNLSCFCKEGTYYDAASNHCTPCSDTGIFCPGRDQSVMIKEGYMALPEEPLSVYKCATRSRCVGMRPPPWNGTNMCDGMSEGVACGTCQQYTSADGEVCSPCTGTAVHRIPAVFVTFVVTLLSCGVIFDRVMRPSGPLTQSSSQLLQFAQMLSVIIGISLPEWPVTFKPVLNIGSIFRVDFSAFRIPVDCVSGRLFMERFVFRLCWPLVLLFGFVALGFVNRRLVAITHRLAGREVKHPAELLSKRTSTKLFGAHRRIEEKYPKLAALISLAIGHFYERLPYWWPIQWLDLKSVILQTHCGLFIMVTRTALSVFVSEEHPNGEATLKDFSDVIVYGGDWFRALTLSIGAIMLYTVFFLAFVVYVVIAAPRKIGTDSNFAQAYEGLWGDYQPCTWWFCAVDLTYGLFHNLTNVLPTGAAFQIVIGCLICLFYIGLCARVDPYRYQMNNRVNVASRSSICCLLLLMTLADKANDDPSYMAAHGAPIGVLMCIFSVLPFIVCICCVASFVWTRKVHVRTLICHRLDCGQKLRDIASIIGSMRSATLNQFTSTLLDNDMRDLSHALDLLQFSLLKMQPKSFTRWRVESSETAFPFRIQPAGGLEPYVVNLDLKQPDDLRDIARKFQDALLKSGTKPRNDLLGFLQAAVHGRRNLSEEDFVLGVSEYFDQRSSCFDTSSTIPTVDDLKAIFEHFDFDGDSKMDMEELSASIRWVIDLPAIDPASTMTDCIEHVFEKSSSSPVQALVRSFTLHSNKSGLGTSLPHAPCVPEERSMTGDLFNDSELVAKEGHGGEAVRDKIKQDELDVGLTQEASDEARKLTRRAPEATPDSQWREMKTIDFTKEEFEISRC